MKDELASQALCHAHNGVPVYFASTREWTATPCTVAWAPTEMHISAKTGRPGAQYPVTTPRHQSELAVGQWKPHRTSSTAQSA